MVNWFFNSGNQQFFFSQTWNELSTGFPGFRLWFFRQTQFWVWHARHFQIVVRMEELIETMKWGCWLGNIQLWRWGCEPMDMCVISFRQKGTTKRRKTRTFFQQTCLGNPNIEDDYPEILTYPSQTRVTYLGSWFDARPQILALVVQESF